MSDLESGEVRRIALIDHNAARRRSLGERIKARISIPAEGHGDLERCIRIMRNAPYQLLVLCVDGFKKPSIEALLAHLHRFHPCTSVLFVLDCEKEAFVASHVRFGKDDYIVGAHRQVELLYRIAAILASAPVPDSRQVSVGGYEIDGLRNRALVNGQEIRLTALESEIAHLLFLRVGEIVPRAYIAQAIWGSPERQFSRALDVHMSQLRKKLRLNEAGGVLRLTGIYNKGYRLEQQAPDLPAAEADVPRTS